MSWICGSNSGNMEVIESGEKGISLNNVLGNRLVKTGIKEMDLLKSPFRWEVNHVDFHESLTQYTRQFSLEERSWKCIGYERSLYKITFIGSSILEKKIIYQKKSHATF